MDLRIQFKRFAVKKEKKREREWEKRSKNKNKKKKSHQLNVLPDAFAHNSESDDQTDIIKGCCVYFTSPVLLSWSESTWHVETTHLTLGTNHLCSQEGIGPAKIETPDLRNAYNILEFPCTGPAVMGSAFSYVAQSARITTVVSNRACDKRCVTCLATLTVPRECQGVKLFGDLRPGDGPRDRRAVARRFWCCGFVEW